MNSLHVVIKDIDFSSSHLKRTKKGIILSNGSKESAPDINQTKVKRKKRRKSHHARILQKSVNTGILPKSFSFHSQFFQVELALLITQMGFKN